MIAFIRKISEILHIIAEIYQSIEEIREFIMEIRRDIKWRNTDQSRSEE
jgi:hypothetical protein